MCAGLALAAAQAGIVEETHSKPVLAASVEVAPFAEIRQRLQTLGTLVNNPIVPMALVPAIQSALQEEMGSFRPDSAITVRTYVYQPAWQIAVTSTVEYAAEDLIKTEVAYADPPITGILSLPGGRRGEARAEGDGRRDFWLRPFLPSSR